MINKSDVMTSFDLRKRSNELEVGNKIPSLLQNYPFLASHVVLLEPLSSDISIIDDIFPRGQTYTKNKYVWLLYFILPLFFSILKFKYVDFNTLKSS